MDYHEIQEQIDKQLQKEKWQVQLFLFLFSLGVYILLLVIGWSLFLSNGGQPPGMNIPGVAKPANPLGDAMTMISVAGMLPVLFQFINLILATKMGERQLRERITGRIMQGEMKRELDAQEAAKNKPKRAMRLTDDGELEEIAEDANQQVGREFHNQRK